MACNLASCGVNPDGVYYNADPNWFTWTTAWTEVYVEQQEEALEK